MLQNLYISLYISKKKTTGWEWNVYLKLSTNGYSFNYANWTIKYT